MSYRHKFLARTTHSGSDFLKFYQIDSDTIGVVHMDLWEDMDSSAVATHGKYNVQSGIVCVRGFDASHGSPDAIGQSVHDALKSCGWRLDVSSQGRLAIIDDCAGDIVASGPITDKRVMLVIAEAMWGYGEKDVMFDGSGNNVRKLEREARNAL